MFWAIGSALLFGFLAMLFLAVGIREILASRFTKGLVFFFLNIVFITAPLLVVAIVAIELLLAMGITFAATLVFSSFAFIIIKTVKSSKQSKVSGGVLKPDAELSEENEKENLK